MKKRSVNYLREFQEQYMFNEIPTEMEGVETTTVATEKEKENTDAMET
jgi:hypothetical protein